MSASSDLEILLSCDRVANVVARDRAPPRHSASTCGEPSGRALVLFIAEVLQGQFTYVAQRGVPVEPLLR